MKINRERTACFRGGTKPLVLLMGMSLILLICQTPCYASNDSKARVYKQQNSKQSQKREKQKRGPKLKLEFFGGYSVLNPDDLNTQADYYDEYYNWYYGSQYEYYRSSHESYFQYNESKNGKFKKIENVFPLGVRIKFHATSKLAFSLAFQYIAKEVTSSVEYQYKVRSAIPDDPQFVDDHTRSLDFSPFSLSIKGYVPLLGVHYTIPLARSFHLEVFVTGGILFASYRYLNEYTSRYSNSYEYWSETVRKDDYEGKGNGFTTGAGMRAEFYVLKNIGLFIEGKYAFQRAGQIFGSGTYDYCYKDSNAPEIGEPTLSWESYWGLSSVSLRREWGDFSGNRLSSFSEKTDPPVKDFHLDLSGLQIRIGLSIHLW